MGRISSKGVEILSEEVTKITKLCNWIESRWLLLAIVGSIVISALVCKLFGAYELQGAVQIPNGQTVDEVLNSVCATNFATFVGWSAGISIAAAVVLRLLQKLFKLPFLAALMLWTLLFTVVLVTNTQSYTAVLK